MYSKKQNTKRIESIFRNKTAMNFDERKFMADSLYKNLDEMLQEPTQERFINLVDNVNMLTNLIFATASRKNRRKFGKTPDVHHWLCERHEMVAPTVNFAHECLISVEHRCQKTGSWTLDSKTVTFVERVITMLQEVMSVAPINLLNWAIDQGAGIHRKKKDGFFHIVHMILDEDYLIKEEIWNERAVYE